MANLTLTIDDALLRAARIRALEHGTSVNALVREFLERYTGSDGDQARRTILAIAERSGASSGPEGRTWSRGDIYDR